MRVDIGADVNFKFNSSEVTLPKANQSYYLIDEVIGRGQLLEAHFRFNSNKIFFKVEINGDLFTELDVKDYSEFAGFKNNDDTFSNKHFIIFNEDEKILSIQFPLGIQYQEGIKFYAKTNDGNKTKKLEGFSLTVNREGE